MERFVKGDIVVMPFPFSNLSQTKKRPALVVASPEGENYILCQITSQRRDSKYSLSLKQKDFVAGSLPVESVIQTENIFTGHKSLILSKRGHINRRKKEQVLKKIVTMLQA